MAFAHFPRKTQRCHRSDPAPPAGGSPRRVQPRTIPGPRPTPEEAAATADECRHLLDMLGEPELRQIALWKVEGFTNEEIAARLDCVPRTVERKVSRIRLLWKQELEELDV